MFVVDTNILVYAADEDSPIILPVGSCWRSGGGRMRPGISRGGSFTSSSASRRMRECCDIPGQSDGRGAKRKNLSTSVFFRTLWSSRGMRALWTPGRMAGAAEFFSAGGAG